MTVIAGFKHEFKRCQPLGLALADVTLHTPAGGLPVERGDGLGDKSHDKLTKIDAENWKIHDAYLLAWVHFCPHWEILEK